MKRVIDRFDAYMEASGLNDNKVTVQLGLTRGLIGKSRQPKRDLSTSVVEKILAYYDDLSRVWLLTGEGDMLKSDVSQSAKGDNTIQVSGNNVDMRNINQSKGNTDDAKRVKELEERVAELTKDKERLQNLVDKMQAQIEKLLEKI